MSVAETFEYASVASPTCKSLGGGSGTRYILQNLSGEPIYRPLGRLDGAWRREPTASSQEHRMMLPHQSTLRLVLEELGLMFPRRGRSNRKWPLTGSHESPANGRYFLIFQVFHPGTASSRAANIWSGMFPFTAR